MQENEGAFVELTNLNQILQYLAWLIALIEIMIGLYILVLNSLHPANRYISASLLLLVMTTFAYGATLTTTELGLSQIYAAIATITTPAFIAMMLFVVIALMRPNWLTGSPRWLFFLAHLIIILPALLTLLDGFLGTNLYFSGLSSENYSGGYIDTAELPQGGYAPIIQITYYRLIPTITLILLLYFALWKKSTSPNNRKLAWVLLGCAVFSALIQYVLSPIFVPGVGLLIIGTSWAAVYTYAGFRQMISERRMQRGSLQARQTFLILIVTLPVLIAVIGLVTSNAKKLLEESAMQNIQLIHQSISNSMDLWLDRRITSLPEIEQNIQSSQLGKGTLAFIVNEENQVVIHSDPTFSDDEFNLASYPPIQTIRSKMDAAEIFASRTDGIVINFSDHTGEKWRAYSSLLPNNWVIVVQQPERELYAGFKLFESVAWIALGVSTLLILVLSTLTIRQALRPVASLTDTATSIAEGDLSRVALLDSDGEFGNLARAFNTMTAQLRESITNLELRIAEHSRDLEKRALQIQVAAEVAREATAIRNPEELLQRTVSLISQRFNFYHAGIFLVDDANQYAVLHAASSEGGQRMLAKGHKLEIGVKGIVGYVANKGKPRIALDVGEDATYFNNPDLPRTRSEMALPMVVRNKVIGVLDVQSTLANAFTEEDIAILQILTDQIALASDNARLLSKSRHAYQELERLYQLQVGQAWLSRLGTEKIAYTYNHLGVHPNRELDKGESVDNENEHFLKVPVIFRGFTLGMITMRRDINHPPWTGGETRLVKNIAAQIGMALENARLLEEIHQRAQDEQIINQISASAYTSLDLETVMRKAVSEICRSLGVTKVQIRLGNGDPSHETDLKPDVINSNWS